MRCRPTRCRAGIPARNGWRNNSRCKPRHPVFRWSSARRRCRSALTITISRHRRRCCAIFSTERLQLYLDFIVNLVDVRDVAAGLVLAMERGQVGHRYILGGESIPLKTDPSDSWRRSAAGAVFDIAVPGAIAGNGRRHAGVHRRSRDATDLHPARPRVSGSRCGRRRCRSKRRSANSATRRGPLNLPCGRPLPIFSTPLAIAKLVRSELGISPLHASRPFARRCNPDI